MAARRLTLDERSELLDLTRRASRADREASTSDQHARAEDFRFLLASSGISDHEPVVRALEDRVESRPEDGPLLNDLAAVYFSRYEHGDGVLDLVRALSAARRAVETEPELPEARFNHALFLGELGARRTAEAAWSHYLAVDPDSDCATEASDRLDRLVRTSAASEADFDVRLKAAAETGRESEVARLVGSSRSGARRVAFDHLAEWGERLVGGRGREAVSLGAARRIGEALAAMDGDRSVLEAVEAIEAIELRNTASLESRAGAHALLGQGSALYEDLRFREAFEAFRRGRGALGEGSGPVEGWLRIGEAVSLYRMGRFARSLEVLAGLEADLPRAYPALGGRAEWIRGSIHIVEGRPSAGLDAYARSVAAYRRVGETERVLSVSIRRAGALQAQGDHEAAWAAWEEILPVAAELSDPLEARSAFETAAMSAWALDLGPAAFDLQREALLWARDADDPVAVVSGLRFLAEPALQLGRLERIEHGLREAAGLLAEIPDEGQRAILEADLGVVEVLVEVARRPEAASARLGEVIAQHRRMGVGFTLPRLHLERARIEDRLGRRAAAVAEIEAAVAETERQREASTTARHRALYLGEAREVFEEAVRLALAEEDVPKAFELSERLKGRVLSDMLVTGGSERHLEKVRTAAEPRSVRSLQALLPAGGKLVSYLALPDELVIFAVDRERMRVERSPVRAERLAHEVEELRTAITRGGAADWRTPARRLGAWAITPLAGWLTRGDDLFVAVDDPIHELPFDVLPWPGDGDRLLLEEVATSVNPSASWLARSLERVPSSERPSRALLVADPALPDAVREVSEIAPFYPRALVLQDRRTLRESFSSEVERCDVFHFGGHGPDISGPSYLETHGGIDLLGLDLTGLRLAVLSSCHSGRRDSLESEGLTRLSWSLLAAGTPAVVASLWEVEDRSARRFAVDFHRFFTEGVSLPQAVRQAKLRARERHPKDVREWAAFELIGF